MWCGVREARQPKPPSTAPTLTIAFAPRYAVRGVVLPGRDPLENRVEHLARAQDRVAVAPALAERRVDEVAVHADAQPERAEVAEHDLALGRLAEQAHVGDAAVRDEVARAGRVAAVLRALRVALLRLLDLAADRRDQDVAAQPHAGVLQRAHRLDVAGDRALHVRDAEPVEPAVALERLRLEAGDVAQPRLAAGVRRVEVAVEHERLPAARARPGPERVRASLLDLLPLHLQAERLVELDHQPRRRLLVAGEARHVDERATPSRRAGRGRRFTAPAAHASKPPIRSPASTPSSTS